MNRAAVIVLNWNGKEYLEDCFKALQEQEEAAERLIMVDNGSTDGSQELVRKKFSEVRVLELGQNRGFAGGVNAGIRAALEEDAEFVVLLNNDAIADKGWLGRLLEEARRDDLIGIVTSKMLQYPDKTKIDSTGDFYSDWGFSFPRGRGETDAGQYDAEELREVFAGSGGASLYRGSMLREIGLFDEDFFAYFEDVDLSFRAQLQGWRVRYQPEAVVWHRIGATSGRISGFARYHTIKNFAFLYTKNMPGWLWWRYLPRYWAGSLLLLVNSLRQGQFGPVAKGMLQTVVKFPVMLARRYRIQRSRTAAPAQIDSLLYHGLPPIQRRNLRRLFGRG